MSTVSTARCAKQNHSHITLGNRANAKKRVATDGELNTINKAIIQLNQAKSENDEDAFIVKLTEAYRVTRNVIRGRING